MALRTRHISANGASFINPQLIKTDRMSDFRATFAISIKYSVKMVGSLYVNAITGALRAEAVLAISSGDR